MKFYLLIAFAFALLYMCFGCKKKLHLLEKNTVASQENLAIMPGEFRNAFIINKELGLGVNLDNMLERGQKAFDYGWITTFMSDGNYGASNFQRIAERGFKHVRIPINWEAINRTSFTAPYTIRPEFLDTVKRVINIALSQNLYVIINMHHHDSLFKSPTSNKEMFLSQWDQIAKYFANMPDKVLFEILNEPHGNLTPELWNVFYADAYNKIRETNKDRCVIIGGADWGGLNGMNKLDLSRTDRHNVILTVHYYEPFQFTHQQFDGSEIDKTQKLAWFDSPMERDSIKKDFDQFSKVKFYGLPVYVGEFGAFKAEQSSRIRWSHAVANDIASRPNFSSAWWGYSSIYDFKYTKKYDESLISALFDRTSVPHFALYGSDFIFPSLDSWKLSSWTGATLAGLKYGRINIVGSSGTMSYQPHIWRDGIPLVQGKYYMVTFDAWSNIVNNFPIVVGEVMRASSEGFKYTTNNSFKLSNSQTTYSYIFQSGYDDSNARLAFCLGNNGSNINVFFNSIAIREIPQLLYESNFAGGSKDGWSFYKQGAGEGEMKIVNDEMKITTTNEGSAYFSLQAYKFFSLKNNQDYLLKFKARADIQKSIRQQIRNISDGQIICDSLYDISLSDKTYYHAFRYARSDSNTTNSLLLNVGKSGISPIYFRNIILTPVTFFSLYKSNFEEPFFDNWGLYLDGGGISNMVITNDKKLKIITTNAGSNFYSVQIFQRTGLNIQNDQLYRATFKASATNGKNIKVQIANSSKDFTITSQEKEYGFCFVANTSDFNAKLKINLGNSNLSDITFTDINLQKVIQ